jgi:GTPase SAR1 family protein
MGSSSTKAKPVLSQQVKLTQENEAEDTAKYKFCVLGSCSTGKASFVQRYSGNKWLPPPSSSTTQDGRVKALTEFSVGVHNFGAGSRVRVELWDSPKEAYRGSAYYYRADAIIIFYDVTSADSWAAVDRWLQEIERYTHEITKILVGNKIDLGYSAIPKEEVLEFCGALLLNHLEMSCATGEGVLHTILQLLAEVHFRWEDPRTFQIAEFISAGFRDALLENFLGVAKVCWCLKSATPEKKRFGTKKRKSKLNFLVVDVRERILELYILLLVQEPPGIYTRRGKIHLAY